MLSTEASKRTYAAIKDQLDLGKPFVIAPQGSSMFPFIIAGRDKIQITPTASCGLPRRGDIVLYRRDDGLLVLHRMHRKKSDGYYFIGDNQTEIEGPLAEEQLLGIATRIIRHNKSFSPSQPLFWIAGRLWLCVRPFRHVISPRAKKLLIFLHIYKER